MLVHSVYFWLKPGYSDEERAAFRAGLESLAGIPVVKSIYVGTPSATPPRPVIDASYDFGLAVVLDDLAGHDVYQTHALHLAFLKQFGACWERVQIYDFE